MDLEAKVQQRKNPRETASGPSIAFFWWMNSLLASGYRKDLELEDLVLGDLAGGMGLTTANCIRRTENLMSVAIWRRHLQSSPLTSGKDLPSMEEMCTCCLPEVQE